MRASVPRRARFRLAPYLAITRIALQQRMRSPLVLASRVGFLALVLFVLSRLWRAVLPAEPGEHGAVDNVWYLALTEWIVLAEPRLYLDIERDVRSGEIAAALSRPSSYLGSKLAEGVGEVTLALAVLGPAGALLAYAFTGGLPSDPRGFLLAIPLGLLASLLALIITALIGVSSFWLLDCSPVYWIWNKSLFLFGGLMVPLGLYPAWLRTLAQLTPFSALVHGPGSALLGFDPWAASWIALRLVLWTGLALALLTFCYRRGLAGLTIRGG